MGTTRYWLPPGSNSVPPSPAVAYSSYWNTLPPAGTTDNLSRRVLTTVRPTSVSSPGSNATKPSPLPGNTAGFQLRTPAFTAARALEGSYRLAWVVAFIGNAVPVARVRLVSSAGVVKATLSTATGTAVQVNGNAQVRTVAGTLSGSTAAVGDFLVFELGFSISSGLGGSATYSGFATTSGVAPATDWPFADGTTTVSTAQGQPWVELILTDPPAPPTGLVISDVGSDTLTATWAAPATGTAPTGYTVSIQDTATTTGVTLDVGNVLSHVFTELDPATEYLVTVHAYNSAGGSAGVTALATTLVGAAYRAVVRLGGRTWDVLAGDPPQLGPVLPVAFGWAVPEDALGFPAQPDPDIANLELVTADHTDLDGVDIGSPMRVSIYTSPSPTARPLATFRGRVADMEAAPHPMGLAWRVLGVGYDAELSSRMVGTGAWPEESGDARAARIAAEAGLAGWSAPTIGSTFEAREPAAAVARDALQDVADQAVSTEGTAFGPSRRVLFHPVTDANGDLTPAAPFAGAEVLRRVDALDVVSAGLVNRATSWRRTKLLDATWVRIDHPGGPTTYGDTRGSAYPPQSVSVTDPRELADLVLDTTPGYRWLTGQPLRLELWADDGPALAVVREWFYRDPTSDPFPWSGRAVLVRPIANSPDGSDTYAGMLTAATLRLEAAPDGGRLVVEFRLRPDIPAQSTVTMRWMDEPAGATWTDELATDPDGTWYDYYTTPRP